MEKHKKAVYGTSMVLFLLLMGMIGWLVGVPMVRMAREPEVFRQWVDSFGIWSRLVFFGIVVFQVLVAFVPGEPIELAAGYIFGFVEGSLLTMAGFLAGSWIIFLLVRRFGIKLVEVFFSKEKIDEVSFLKNPQKSKILAFIIMTIPGTPKDFLSYFAGLMPISLKDWLCIVAVGRTLSLVTSTASGAAAGKEKYVFSLVMFAITALISGIGIYWYRKICKQERNNR